MSQHTSAAPETRIEDGYLQGYDPVSLLAPHASLNKNSTWIGMGLLLSVVPPLGVIVFALGAYSVSSQEQWMLYTILGVILAVVLTVAGAAFIHYGRRDYRAYVKRTGRKN